MSSGGARVGSGRKTNYVSREVKLPKEHHEAIKIVFSRGFNQLFRDWVKSILGEKNT